MGILEFDPFNGSFDGRVLVSQKIRMRVVGVYRRAEQNDDRYRWPRTCSCWPPQRIVRHDAALII